MKKELATIESNIWKFYLSSTLGGSMLVMPIIIPFYFANGLSMAQVFLIQGTFSFVSLFLEIPAGYLADILGRKKTILWSTIFWFLGMLVYSLSYGFWGFLFAEAILGVSIALLSGADSAIIYDSLLQMKKVSTFKKVWGRILAVGHVSEAVGAIVGGLLAVISLRFPFYVYTGLSFLSIPVAWSLIEPKRRVLDTHKGHLHNLKKIIVFSLHTNKKLKWVIAYLAVVFSGTLIAGLLFQPYFKYVGIPLAWFGVLWALNNVGRGFFSWYAHNIELVLGRKLTFMLPAFVASLAFMSMGFIAVPAGVFVILLVNFAYGVLNPVSTHYINELTTSKMRATVLSIKNIPMRLLYAILSPFIGWLMDVYSLPFAVIASSILFLVLAIIPLFMLRKYRVI